VVQGPVEAQTAEKAGTPVIPRFHEETEAAGLQSRFEGEDEFMVGGGVATFDCDNDGLPEVYVTAGVNKAKFYRNRSTRGGPIKLQEERSGLALTNAVGAYPLDIDGDGQVDLVVLRVGEVEVFRGLGACKFQRANDLWNIHTGNGWHTAFSATWEAGQSWPTLAIGTYVDRSKPEFPWGSCTPGILLRPNATGNGFANLSPLLPGHCALSMLFSDWNRSGQTSLRVSNDREYYKNGQEQLWSFKPGEPPVLYGPAQGWKPLQIWGMGIASHDLDGDGRPEVFLTSMADNKLQKLDAGADSITVAPCLLQTHLQPRPQGQRLFCGTGPHVAPQLRFIPAIDHHHIQQTIPIQIRQHAAPATLDAGHACGRSHIGKRPISLLQQQVIGVQHGKCGHGRHIAFDDKEIGQAIVVDVSKLGVPSRRRVNIAT